MKIRGKIIVSIVSSLFFLVLTGCGKETPAPKNELKTLTRAELQKELSRSKGKLVLLNYWATWCKSCLPELKTLEKLQKKYGPKGLRVICVSVDKPGDKVQIAFVKYNYSEVAAIYGKFISGEAKVKDIMTPLGNEWLEIVPVTYLLDRQGRIQEKFVGSKSIRSIEPKLKMLLR